jgi:putative ABC transport system ATP-binding protein
VRGEKIGFIFQSFNLLPHLSAVGNVAIGLKFARKTDARIAKEALVNVGLIDRIHHRPNELSGASSRE